MPASISESCQEIMITSNKIRNDFGELFNFTNEFHSSISCQEENSLRSFFEQRQGIINKIQIEENLLENHKTIIIKLLGFQDFNTQLLKDHVSTKFLVDLNSMQKEINTIISKTLKIDNEIEKELIRSQNAVALDLQRLRSLTKMGKAYSLGPEPEARFFDKRY